MSKTSLALLIILLLTSGIYVFVSASSKKVPPIASTKNVPTQSPIPDTTLSLVSKPSLAGQNVEVAVQITSPNDNLNLAQIEIAYDPLALTVIEITPDKYFNNPVILLDNINPRTGRISYALGCSGSYEAGCINKNVTTIANISFIPTQSGFPHTTAVKLLPKSLMRTNTGNEIQIITSETKITLP